MSKIKNKQFTLGAIISYVAIAFNIVSGLLYTPWMIHTIGDDQYALYSLATSVVSMFMLDFGISASVTKFLSNYYANGDYDKANRFMGIVYKVFFAITAVIAVVLSVVYLFIDSIYVKLSANELAIFKNLFIIVAVYSVFSFPCLTFNGTLIANERFIEVKICNLGQKVFNVALIVIFLLIGLDVYSLVLVNVLSNVVFYMLKYYFIRKKTQTRAVMSYWDKNDAKELFSYSVWVTVLNIAQRFIFNIMPTVITACIGASMVTMFSLSSVIEGYVYMFSDAINGMFMPKVSKILVNDKSGNELLSLMVKVSRYHVCTLGLLFVGFLCLGRQFVTLWMGSGYLSVYYCTLAMIFPSLFTTPMQVGNTALLSKGIIRPNALIYVFISVVNVALSVILLPIINIYGAAVSVCICYLISFALKGTLIKREFGINFRKYFKETYLKWSAVALLTALAGVILNTFITFGGWLSFLIKGIIIFTVYFGLFVALCLDGSEKSSVKQKIKSILRR